MDIKTFLDLSTGKWLSQRTTHSLDEEKAENNKTEIVIEQLASRDDQLVRLCEQAKIDPVSALGGLQTSWDTTASWDRSAQRGSVVIVLIPDEENAEKGQLLQLVGGQSPSIVLSGQYSLGTDEALTLQLEQDSTYWQERIWFASPNLRLRSSLILGKNGNKNTAFYSEIRRMPPKNEKK